MLAIAWCTVRARLGGFVGAFLATALAVALVACWGTLLNTAVTAPVTPHRYAAAPVIVAQSQNLTVHNGSTELLPVRPQLDAALLPVIAHRPGVARAVPDVTYPVRLGGATAQAHNATAPGIAPVRTGRAPRTADEVAVGAALHVRLGSRVPLTTPTGQRTVTVTGITAGRGVVVATVPGKVDAIGVYGRPGVSAAALAKNVRAVVGGADVRTGADRGKAEFPDLVQGKSDLGVIAGSIGGIAVMVAIFVVAATLSLSVQQRGREIALLRAVAATPRQIRRMVAGEGLIVALAAALAGCLPGWLLAWAMHAAMVHRGVLPAELALRVSWIPFVVAGGAGVVVIQLAGLVAGRRAARIRPTAALSESSVQPRRIGVFRLLLGLCALGGGITLLTVALSAQGDDAAGTAAGMVMILMVAVGLLGPVIAWLGALLLDVPIRTVSRVGGFLAVVHARARSCRFASAITPVALTVSLAFITGFLQSTILHAQNEQGARRVVADRIIRADGPGVPRSEIAAIARQPGVTTAVGLLPTQVLRGTDLTSYDAEVVTGPVDRVLDLGVTHGSLRRDGVALSSTLATTLHAQVGARVALRLADGTPVHPRVAAVYTAGLGFGDAILPWRLAAGHVGAAAPTTVLVNGTPHVSLHLQTREAYRSAAEKEQAVNAWLNYLLLGVIVGYTAIAVVNTLVMTTVERRREFALLRLVGATPGQVLRMMRCEAGLVALLGVAVGTAVGYATLVPFSHALGPGVSPYVPPLAFAVLAGSAVVVALLATLLPTRRTLATAPIEAATVRE